jgi:hypothetical protein
MAQDGRLTPKIERSSKFHNQECGMRKLSLSVCLAFAFFVASAVAQVAPGGGGQGTQNSSPSMQQPSQQPGQQPGIGQPDSNTPGAQTDQNTANQNRNNGERKLKGCVQSQGGQYMLETKKGKTVALAGQDVSAHVGHEVAVKGTWENGMSATSSGSADASGKTFNVTSVDMISDSCSGKSHSGNMDHSSQGTGNSGNSTTQPPQ